jgi:hypothetical protein
VANKCVEICFANFEEGTESWFDFLMIKRIISDLYFRPLHFVRIIVGNQVIEYFGLLDFVFVFLKTVTSSLNLKHCIEPRPNHFIAEQLAPSLSHQEYILFNVPISEDEFE